MDGERDRENRAAQQKAPPGFKRVVQTQRQEKQQQRRSLSLSLFISIPFALKYLPQNVPAHVRLAFREVVGDRVDRHMIGHKINAILPLAPLLDLVESREINPE